MTTGILALVILTFSEEVFLPASSLPTRALGFHYCCSSLQFRLLTFTKAATWRFTQHRLGGSRWYVYPMEVQQKTSYGAESIKVSISILCATKQTLFGNMYLIELLIHSNKFFPSTLVSLPSFCHANKALNLLHITMVLRDSRLVGLPVRMHRLGERLPFVSPPDIAPQLFRTHPLAKAN